jgi:hypothetical protein
MSIGIPRETRSDKTFSQGCLVSLSFPLANFGRQCAYLLLHYLVSGLPGDVVA